MSRLILFNKPYGVICQFTDGEGRATLADVVRNPGVDPSGRLDHHSEGLVVLTDDGPLQHALSHPTRGKEKGYWAQVEGAPGSATGEAVGSVMDARQLARGDWRKLADFPSYSPSAAGALRRAK